MGRPAFYVPRTVRSYLRRQINAKTSYQLTQENFAGRKVVAFDGVPVRRCDALVLTETLVS